MSVDTEVKVADMQAMTVDRPIAPDLPELSPQAELALLARVLFREGYDDHLAGHITYRQADETLFVNPFGLTWDEIRALCTVWKEEASIMSAAFEILLLTAQRENEVLSVIMWKLFIGNQTSQAAAVGTTIVVLIIPVIFVMRRLLLGREAA